MRLRSSLKFKSTVSCLLTILALSTIVACGNDDHNGTNNSVGAPSTPTPEELAAQQEAARQQELLARPEARSPVSSISIDREIESLNAILLDLDEIETDEPRRSLSLEELRSPKYFMLRFHAFRSLGHPDLAIPSSSRELRLNPVYNNDRRCPGVTNVGCIKLAIDGATDLERAALEPLAEISRAYSPMMYWGGEVAVDGRPIPNTSDRELFIVPIEAAQIRHHSQLGSCGEGVNPNRGYSCVLGAEDPTLDSNVDGNWWRVDPRLTGTLYFNETFRDDREAAGYVCESISGRLYHNGRPVETLASRIVDDADEAEGRW